MPSFTISIAGSSVVNGSKSWTLSDADVQSLSTFLIAKYSGAAVVQMTAQQALLTWAQDFVNHTISDVKAYQQSTAVVPPITFT